LLERSDRGRGALNQGERARKLLVFDRVGELSEARGETRLYGRGVRTGEGRGGHGTLKPSLAIASAIAPALHGLCFRVSPLRTRRAVVSSTPASTAMRALMGRSMVWTCG